MIDDISVNEFDGCMSPMAPVAENITDNSANISWTPRGDANQWEVVYGKKGFELNDIEGTLISADAPQITLTGLDYGTEYDVYVRSVCADGEVSEWVINTDLFQTECQPGTIPFYDSFEIGQKSFYLLSCWTQEKISGDNKWSAWLPARTGELCASLYSTSETWMFYPLELDADTTYELELYASATYNPPYNSTIEVAIGTEDNAAAMTMTIIPESGPLPGYYERFHDYFSPPDSGTYYLGIKGNAVDQFIVLDDISVNVFDGCLSPKAPEAENITVNSADISWTPRGAATQWEVAYVEKGYNVNDLGTFISVNDPQITLTDLYPGTEYDIYVRSICEEGDTSDWADDIAQFKTNCPVGTIPFFEGFEYGQTPGLPLKCWTQQKMSGIFSWTPTTSMFPRTGAYAGLLAYPNESWMFRPLELNSEMTYEVEFYARAYQPGANVTIEVAFGTNDDADSMTTIISESDPLPSNYIKFSGYFTPVSSGTYYLGIKGTTENTYIIIDDISVQEHDGCFSPTTPVADNITTDSADISWTPQGNESQWEVVYGKTGFDINDSDAGTSLTVEEPQATLTNLEYGTNYDFYIRSVCGEGSTSTWILSQFQTDCQPGTIPFFDGFEIGQKTNQILNCWTQEKISGNYNWFASIMTNMGELSATLAPNSETWMFHPLELYEGSTYELEFYVAGGITSNSPAYATFEVGLGTEDNAEAMTTVLVPESDPLTSNFGKVTAHITPSSSGTYYIGIKGNAAGHYVVIDNISVTELEPCLAVEDLSYEALEWNEYNFTWNSSGELWKVWVNGYSLTEVSSPEFTMMNLEPQTNYTIGISTVCGTVYSPMQTISITTGSQPCDNPVLTVLTTDIDGNEMQCILPDEVYYASVTLTGGSETASYNVSDENSTKTMSSGDTEIFGPYTVESTHGFTAVDVNNSACTAEAAVSSPPDCETPEECEAPTELEFNNITYNSAMASWNGGSADTWAVSLNDAESEITNNEFFEFTDLEPSTAYTVNVKAICGDDESESISGEFTTEDEPCDAVTDLHFEELEWNEYEITWTSDADSWTVYVNDDAGIQVTQPEYMMTNLQPMQTYSVSVVVNCEFTDSDPETISFTTENEPCDAVTDLQYEELDWNEYIITWTSDADSWTVYVNGDSGTTVTEPEYILTQLSPEFTYYVEVVAHCTGGNSSSNSTEFITGTEPCDAVTDLHFEESDWNEYLITWDAGDADSWTVSINGEEGIQVTQPEYMMTNLQPSETYSVSVVVNCEFTSSDPETISFTTENEPCDAITNLQFEELDWNEYLITWDGGDADSWTVYINGDTGTMVTEPEYTMTGLSPEFTYYVEVVAHCTGGNSESESTEFTTGMEPCDNSELLYISRVWVSGPASGDQSENISGFNDDSQFNEYILTPVTTPGYGNHTNIIHILNKSEGNILNFEIEADGLHPDYNYHYEIWVDRNLDKILSNDGWGDYNEQMVSIDIPGGVLSSSFDLNDLVINEYDYQLFFCDIPNGIFPLRIIMTVFDSNCNEVYGETEDYLLEVTGDCNDRLSVDPTEFNGFNFYPNPVTSALNLEAAQPIQKVEVFNLLGQKVLETNPETTQTQINTQSLSSGVYMMKVTMEGVDKTFKVIRK